ncbi:MAG: hypothetical protein BWX64_00849 [Acidobacteria bacterium ADurb.Bin051]|nr:MAG: hypothetical protein BWX64_00849 [Acidobacteria bacterium ADurb.Bin051]HPA96549.1 DUF4301 family protein [Thermoanaerobaculia bacterium]
MNARAAVLSPADLAALAAAGIAAGEAERQLALLAAPPPPLRLERPCAVGDGIVRLAPGDEPALLAAAREAAARGALAKFVPASGAATRMFTGLLALAADPDAEGGRREAAAVGTSLARLALRDRLATLLAPRGETAAALAADPVRLARAIVGADGLDLAALPKGLLPFHLYPEGERTAFVEHLVEGAAYLADREGLCRFDFTVPPGTDPLFHAALAEAGERHARRLGVRFEVRLSHQERATDTLALAPDGTPFRQPDGRLLLRPGGHGALLGNLEATGRELVLVKNIDNVLPADRHAEVAHWQQLLAGLALTLTARRDAMLRALAAAPARETIRAAATLLAALADPEAAALGAEPSPAHLRDRLRRPLRVCGVVRNEGEPGGGPFWVRDEAGRESLQIVEGAQVARSDPEQAAIWRASTHFNPVQLACALRDEKGKPFPLARFVDETAVVIAEKREGSRPLRALERPGLWNGAMARWHTVFVEVPVAIFAPVKTLLDLARPEHQAGAAPPVDTVSARPSAG